MPARSPICARSPLTPTSAHCSIPPTSSASSRTRTRCSSTPAIRASFRSSPCPRQSPSRCAPPRPRLPLLVLPFSLKGERDQIKSRAVADDLAALKAGLKDDPPRMARAIGAFYRRHRITPLRNLIALLFLPIMALAMTAVQHAVSNGGQHFGGTADLPGGDGC